MLTPSSALAPGNYQVVLESDAGRDLRSMFGNSLTAPSVNSTGMRVVTRFSVEPAQ
jgi:hypothetical protein